MFLKQKQGKLLTIWLFAILFVSCVSYMFASTGDVKSHWGYPAMQYALQERYLATEYTYTELSQPVLLGEFANMLVGSCNIPVVSRGLLSNVSETSPYYVALLTLVGNGFISDIEAVEDSTLTRERMSNLLADALALTDFNDTKLRAFSDSGLISEKYLPSMAAVVNAGIYHGYSSVSIKPLALVTRSQVLQIFYNLTTSLSFTHISRLDVGGTGVVGVALNDYRVISSVKEVIPVTLTSASSVRDIGFPLEVSVILNDNSEESLPVVWNLAGVSVVDKTITFSGFLLHDASIGNPNNCLAQITVGVGTGVQAVKQLFDIVVSEGDLLAEVLPRVVDVLLTDDRVVSARIDWGLPVGAIATTPTTFVGELVFDDTSILVPAGLSVHINLSLTESLGSSDNSESDVVSPSVSLKDSDVLFVNAPPIVYVPRNVSVSDVDVPSVVDVVLCNGDALSVDVIWDAPSVASITEDMTVVGTLVMPDGVTNSRVMGAKLSIIVHDGYIPMGVVGLYSVPVVPAARGVEPSLVDVPSEVVVYFTDGSLRDVPVIWDVPSFTVVENSCVIYGDLQLASDVSNIANLRACFVLSTNTPLSAKSVTEGRTDSTGGISAASVLSTKPIAIQVGYNTRFSELELPTVVSASLSDGRVKEVPVFWELPLSTDAIFTSLVLEGRVKGGVDAKLNIRVSDSVVLDVQRAEGFTALSLHTVKQYVSFYKSLVVYSDTPLRDVRICDTSGNVLSVISVGANQMSADILPDVSKIGFVRDLVVKVVSATVTRDFPLSALKFRDGSESLPFVIATESDLRVLRDMRSVVLKDTYFEQIADISLTGDWAPLPYVRGYFGNGHVISNLKSTKGGLFLGAEDAEISVFDLTLDSVNIEVQGGDVGGVVNVAHKGLFENVHIQGGRIKGVTNVGGLVGRLVAPVLSESPVVFLRCSNTAAVDAADSVAGGLAGVLRNGSVSESWNVGTVTAVGIDVGGLIGRHTYVTSAGIATVKDSYNAGAVKGANTVGGISGFSKSNLLRCSNFGIIVGAGVSVGGVSGQFDGTMTSCVSVGTVTDGGVFYGGKSAYKGNSNYSFASSFTQSDWLKLCDSVSFSADIWRWADELLRPILLLNDESNVVRVLGVKSSLDIYVALGKSAYVPSVVQVELTDGSVVSCNVVLKDADIRAIKTNKVGTYSVRGSFTYNGATVPIVYNAIVVGAPIGQQSFVLPPNVVREGMSRVQKTASSGMGLFAADDLLSDVRYAIGRYTLGDFKRIESVFVYSGAGIEYCFVSPSFTEIGFAETDVTVYARTISGRETVSVIRIGFADGSYLNPYHVATKDDLLSLSTVSGASSLYFLQTADIDLSGVQWTALKGVRGYDGGGHVISNLTSDTGGLFDTLQGSSCIKNVRLRNVDIIHSAAVGAIVNTANSGVTIENCHVLSGSIGGVSSVGGIAGTIGGITVTNTSSIMYCSNSAEIVSVAAVCANTGGILGSGYGVNIIQSWNSGDITVSGDSAYNVGGISGLLVNAYVGVAMSSINDCYNTGAITGGRGIAGIVGFTDASVSNCYNSGTLASLGSVGGIALHSSGTAHKVLNWGSLSGVNVGGLFASFTGQCFDSVFTGGEGYTVGGSGTGVYENISSPLNLSLSLWASLAWDASIWRWDSVFMKPVLINNIAA